MPRFPFALLTLCSLLGAPSANAVVIDTFESGPFSMTLTPGQADQLHQTPNLGHCIAMERMVTGYHDGTSGLMTISLTPLQNVDDALMVTFPFGPESQLQLDYSGGPWDLTLGHDQIGVRVVGPESGTADLWVTAWDDDDWGFSNKTITKSGTYFFDYAEFAGEIDFWKIRSLRVDLRATSGETWGFQHIETRMKISAVTVWDIRDILVFADQAMNWDMHTPDIAGATPFLGPALTMAVQGSNYEGLHLIGSDSGGALGSFGEASMVSVMWDASSFTDGSFDLQFNMNEDVDFDAQPLGAPEVTSHPDGFSISYDVLLTGSASVPDGILRQEMIVSPGPGQVIVFENVEVTPTQPGARSSSPGYAVSFEAVGDDVDTGEPIMEVYLSGGFRESSLATSVAVPRETKTAMELRAVPTVTRAASRLTLSHPADRNGSIDLFDVRGRLVRRLAVTAGSDGATWDGVDRNGSPVASGVYLARYVDREGVVAGTRVVRLR